MTLEHAVRELEMHLPYIRYEIVQEATEVILKELSGLQDFKAFWDDINDKGFYITRNETGTYKKGSYVEPFDLFYQIALYQYEDAKGNMD